MFRVGFLNKGGASVYSSECLAPLVGRRFTVPCLVTPGRPTCSSLYGYFVHVAGLCSDRRFNCRLTLGTFLLRTVFLLLRCDRGGTSFNIGASSSGLGGILSCVRIRCTRDVRITRLTKLYCFDRCRFVHFFGGRVGVAYIRCVGGIHLRGSIRRFRHNGASVLSISLSIKFRGLDCFRETFGGECRVAPLSFVGDLRWLFVYARSL